MYQLSTGWNYTPVPVGQRSRKQIAPFVLHQPASLKEACEIWHRAEGRAAFLAGGVDLVNEMKQGYRPAELIDLRAVPELREIALTEAGVSLGAMVTHQQLADMAGRRDAAHPILASLGAVWSDVANRRVRHKGTLGGNLMSRKPGYDLMPCLVALDARLTFLRGDGSSRLVPAREGLPQEPCLLHAIHIPVDWTAMAFERGHKPALAVAVAVSMEEGGRLRRTGVAIGGAGGAATIDAIDTLPAYEKHVATVCIDRLLSRLGGLP